MIQFVSPHLLKGKAPCLICALLFALTILAGCGYRMVGSRPLPFDSVTINPVINDTYEPRLEERLHRALSREFIGQGIRVLATGGDVDVTAAVRTFQLGAIAYIDEKVQEQEIILKVDVLLRDRERVMEFTSIQSPIKITFETAGTVTDTVILKERATDKAFSEITREIISKMIIQYAQ